MIGGSVPFCSEFAGPLADLSGMATGIGVVALLALLSGLFVVWRMPQTLRHTGY
jgi:hypothetical protein